MTVIVRLTLAMTGAAVAACDTILILIQSSEHIYQTLLPKVTNI